MKIKTYDYEILELLKENKTIKQKEIRNELISKNINISFREIRLSVEKLRRKFKFFDENGKSLFIVSGNFGYSLQPIDSALFRQFIGLQKEKIKSMQETLELFI